MLEQLAVQRGAQAAQLMFTGENAESKQHFNAAYNVAVGRFNAQDAKHAAELNLAAIKQDTILSNTKIQLQQNQAEAAALVSAAAAGVVGGSVDDVIYETERTAAFAVNANVQASDNRAESQLASIGSNTSSLLTMEDNDNNLFGDILEFGGGVGSALMDSEPGELKHAWEEAKVGLKQGYNWAAGLFSE